MSLFAPLRAVVGALTSEDSPRQIALGFAMGMVVGLVPKGNLIAVLLLFILMCARVNLGAGMVAAFTFTWVGYLIDPISNYVGYWLLTLGPLHGFWTWLYNVPLMPWTNFNDTIVMGSLIVGLAALYPMYRIALPPAGRISRSLSERLKRYKIGQALFGADIVSRSGI